MTISKVGRTGQSEQQAQADRRQRWEALLEPRKGQVDLVSDLMALAGQERSEIAEENRRLRSQRAEAMQKGLVAQHLRRLVDEAYRAWDGPGRTREQYLADLRRWADLRKRMLDAIRSVAIAESVAEENEEFLGSIADMSEHHAGVWQERALKAEADLARLRQEASGLADAWRFKGPLASADFSHLADPDCRYTWVDGGGHDCRCIEPAGQDGFCDQHRQV